MKDKSKEDGNLNVLRIKIGELIQQTQVAELYFKPNKIYSSFQKELWRKIIKEYDSIEYEILNLLRGQEYIYLRFIKIFNKFTVGDKSDISEKDFVELILNTDKSLLNAKSSLNDKITQALTILAKKIHNSKEILLDIYYMHKIIELEGDKLGWMISKEVANKINEIIDKYFKVNSSYATSGVYYLLKQISDTENFDDSFNLYYENLDLFLDIIFIKVNSGEKGTFIPVDLYEPFKEVDKISENLYSPFYGGKVNFVSGMSTQRIHNMTMSQRNVSLDVNTVSYVRTMADGRIDKLPSEHIKELIKNIDVIKKTSSFDYLPYLLENFIFSPENEDRIMQTVRSVERYFYPDNEEYNKYFADNIRSMFTEYEEIRKVKEDYFIGYSLLLLICYINFKFAKMKPLQKLENFCLYMNQVLFIFREPFVEIAFNFFEKGNQYRFFKKIQRNAHDMIKNLKNMAWDVFHLYSLELVCSTVNKGADMLIPYFYCFDKGLLELKECFDLETLFVNLRTGERICFYHKHSYPMEIINNYKTIEMERNRRTNFSHENIAMQIEFLENQINSLW